MAAAVPGGHAALWSVRVWERTRRRPYGLRKGGHGASLEGSGDVAKYPVAFVPSRPWRGLTTTRGKAASARARYELPGASRPISVGGPAWSRTTRTALPVASFVTVQR